MENNLWYELLISTTEKQWREGKLQKHTVLFPDYKCQCFSEVMKVTSTSEARECISTGDGRAVELKMHSHLKPFISNVFRKYYLSQIQYILNVKCGSWTINLQPSYL